MSRPIRLPVIAAVMMTLSFTDNLPFHWRAVEKRSSAALRYKPHRSTYFDIRLALRFLRALHLSIFEQPA
jgi:hypothetical protein